jgi:hypothetical protein
MVRMQKSVLLCAWGAIAVSVMYGHAGPASGTAKRAGDEDAARILDELVVLSRRAEWGAGETARATYLVLRICQKGRSAVPYVRQRFLAATTLEDGFLCAAFIALHGKTRDMLAVRTEFETSENKRTWLRELVGNEKAMTDSLRRSQRWREIPTRLPITLRGRTLAALCMQSSDPLVRRAGLYFGFWLAGESYVKELRRMASRDTDGMTRRYARYLYKVRRHLANR